MELTNSLESVKVKDRSTGAILSNALPQGMFLGLFTWCDTNDYATTENWNSEVDIEILQLGVPGNADAL